MSCGCNDSSSSSYPYNGACCLDVPYPQVSHESVPSLIDNLTTALYGGFYNPSTQTGFITKSVVNGRIRWNIPCDPNNTSTLNNIPRNSGEGLLCYLLRAMNLSGGTLGFVTATGVQTLSNKTLDSTCSFLGTLGPDVVTTTGVQTLSNKTLDASCSFLGTLGAGVVTSSSIANGAIVDADINASAAIANSKLAGAPTNLNTASTIVLRDGSGNFSAGTITGSLSGNATTATTATTATNFSGSLAGDVTGTQSSTSVVKVNGASVPASKTIVGTNSSGQIVDASSATLANSTTGTATYATNLSGGAAGSLPYQTGSGATTTLPLGTTGKILTAGASAPQWATDHLGSTTNDSASAGYVGEWVAASVASGSAITLTTTATTYSITSISLTAGDWEVRGMGAIHLSTTILNYVRVAVSTASSAITIPTGSYDGSNSLFSTSAPASLSTTLGTTDINLATKSMRVSLSATTTIYLVAYSAFTGTAPTAYGNIEARRLR